MTNKKISELTLGDPAEAGDELPINRSGNNFKVTAQTIANLGGGSGSVTPAALTRVDDTNVTLALGGTPATALLQATSITAGWTGTLAVSRGGTNISGSYTKGDLLAATGAATLVKVGVGASGTVLSSDPGQASGLTYTVVTGGSTTPGAPVNSVQFNNPLNTFDGDAEFLWDPGGDGLILGVPNTSTSQDYNILSGAASFVAASSTLGGNLFQGHTAIGNYADVDRATFAPGDPINGFSFQYRAAFVLSEAFLSNGTFGGAGMVHYPSVEFTGNTAIRGFVGLDIEPAVVSDSVGDFNNLSALAMFGANYGSGDIISANGFSGGVQHAGAGNVGDMRGLAILVFADGAGSGTVDNIFGVYIDTYPSVDVTNVYGLFITDQSGIGSGDSFNILSGGTASLNVFEGSILLDNYLEMTEMAAPSAPAANKARLFTRDNGGGKTQLAVLFPSGAVQVIATEP